MVMVMKTIGEILKNTREDLDHTQIDVMKRTGINNKTLSGYENGVSEPDLATLVALLNLYNLSADEVLGIKNTNGRLCATLNSSEYELLSCFRSLDKRRRKDLLTMIRALSISATTSIE